MARLSARLLGVLALFCAVNAVAIDADADARLRVDLRQVASQRLFFGHQSVGDNLLRGVQQLASDAGVGLAITEVSATSEAVAAGLNHAHIGENTQPLKKLQAFEQATHAKASKLDLAVMKFCYVDITPQTDVKALFQAYQATTDRLHAQHPGVRIVHVTAPLVMIQTGVKAMLKRMLGRAPYGVLENSRREAYNALLRAAYQGKEPVFDLARQEATTPHGVTTLVEWQGQQVLSLAPVYSDDGEHLNALGQKQLARDFIATLAAVAR
ncbi:MAG: hypothetical protein RLZZ401_2025 [Pseudomonadota bacterium]|jgi:lysophospholipase L1-like esterase